jgi:hypothetical protein
MTKLKINKTFIKCSRSTDLVTRKHRMRLPHAGAYTSRDNNFFDLNIN